MVTLEVKDNYGIWYTAGSLESVKDIPCAPVGLFEPGHLTRPCCWPAVQRDGSYYLEDYREDEQRGFESPGHRLGCGFCGILGR